ncbi:uncharacterized protein BJ212DRAFT_1297293 [Suillus subaureus]|uniref:Uncharacterized protein n=1 Tax=Suillus subaureus TaxID=48587 RepID=A0A9P7EIB6_9AGAM|nr:uncharacterized protein BJ212DRAFT_1297293 [Suillus subaureus]KAG1822044.1 hypothetical protein BJ212DRAFT_1297293 [Suillus subaureus]
MISDLLCLWTFSIKIPMESGLQGHVVRVILVVVICDKPAAHKMGGFASHSHMNFCMACWISIRDKDKPDAFVDGAFKPWTNEEQHQLGDRYRLVKTHFYNIWVQSKILRPNCKLNTFHKMLADFTVPGLCGKFPMDIGMPLGGSLTTDQWLLLATVYGLIINHVAMISKFNTEHEAQAKGKANDKKALEEVRKKGKDAYTAEKARITLEKLAVTEAKKQEKLCITAAKQAEKVHLAAEKKAKAVEIRLYGSSVIKPNHHYAMHVLKSFKTNNHTNRELETTFFQEFQRVSHIGHLTYSLLCHPKDLLPSEVAEIMLKATNEEHRTVVGLAALSQELDDVSADVHAYSEVLEIFQFTQDFYGAGQSLWFS